MSKRVLLGKAHSFGIFGAHTTELYTLRDVVMHAEWYVGH